VKNLRRIYAYQTSRLVNFLKLLIIVSKRNEVNYLFFWFYIILTVVKTKIFQHETNSCFDTFLSLIFKKFVTLLLKWSITIVQAWCYYDILFQWLLIACLTFLNACYNTFFFLKVQINSNYAVHISRNGTINMCSVFLKTGIHAGFPFPDTKDNVNIFIWDKLSNKCQRIVDFKLVLMLCRCASLLMKT